MKGERPELWMDHSKECILLHGAAHFGSLQKIDDGNAQTIVSPKLVMVGVTCQ